MSYEHSITRKVRYKITYEWQGMPQEEKITDAEDLSVRLTDFLNAPTQDKMSRTNFKIYKYEPPVDPWKELLRKWY